MPAPTQSEVSKYVTETVAAFTRRDVDRIADDMVLAKPPLRMDGNDLVHLATSLRGYVMVYRRGEGTITSRDTKKDKETVGGLAKVVFARIQETD